MLLKLRLGVYLLTVLSINLAIAQQTINIKTKPQFTQEAPKDFSLMSEDESLLTGKAQQTKTIKPTDYIKLEVPEDFYLMSEDERLLTFPSIRMPIAAVANIEKTCLMGINKSNNSWPEDDLDILKLFYKSNIQALHDEVSFIQEQVKEINGKRFIVFEFTSVAKDDGNALKKARSLNNYNYIQYAIVKNDIIIFNFYTNIRLMVKYKEKVASMMNSVSLKKIKK